MNTSKSAPRSLAYLQRLLIPESGRTRVVNVAEIIYISAAKNYVEVHTATGSFLHRTSMDALEAALDPALFVRIHRSTIVALDRVREVRNHRPKRSVLVNHDCELAVSASCLDLLMARLAGPAPAPVRPLWALA